MATPTRQPSSPTPGRPARSEVDLAGEVWARMKDLVRRNDPTDELRRTLGLGRGTGRVKALLSLGAGPLTLAELARAIGIDPPYATLIANELEALGLLSRTADPRDRRKKSVQLTAAGELAVRKAEQIINRPPLALSEMSKADLRCLLGLLDSANRPRTLKASGHPPTSASC